MEDAMRFFLTMLCAALLILPACNRNEPRNTQAASEDRANVTDQMKIERDNYVKSVDARLSEFDQRFDGLDKRAAAMTGSTKTNFKTAIDSLRDQRKAVATKLDDLKKVSIESWTTLRGEVDSAMANLDRSYTQVSDQYQTVPGSTTTKTKRY